MAVAQMDMQPSVVELTILTGFLGSGKTTLLSAYLCQPQAADTAVIVNEVGEIDLDGAILTSTASKVPMALLSNGCVCCSVGDDLTGTIAGLIEAREQMGLPPLQRIVLETSGLSRPGPILRSLGPVGSHLRVSVVSTFDCVQGEKTLSLPEAAAQLAAAQRVVMTRLDLVDAAQVSAVQALISSINPLAEVVCTPHDGERAQAALACLPRREGALDRQRSQALQWQEEEVSSSQGEAQSSGLHGRLRTVLCRFSGPTDADLLAQWLDNLAGLCGERLLRVKGVVDVHGASHPVLVQCVGTLFAPLVPMPTPPADRFLVVIVRGVEMSELGALTPLLPMTLRRAVPRRAQWGRSMQQVLSEACA